jgi:hypothetical protein
MDSEQYAIPWDETPARERDSASAVFVQVSAFLEMSAGKASRLSRSQKSQFIASCWTAQIYKHIPDPTSGYVVPCDELPTWQ